MKRLNRRTFAGWSAGSLGSLALGARAAAAAYPAAPSRPVTEVLHGQTVSDPYRNLEDLADPQTRAWLKAQGEHAASELARIDGRDAMAQRIEALSRESGDALYALMRMPSERLYYLLRKAGENQFKLMMRQGLDGAERVLVDPEKLTQATGVPHAINYFVPSWDGKTLACGLSAGGSEDASLHLLDIASGQAIGQPIPRVHESLVRWAPDSRSLTYNQVRELPKGTPETETYLDTTVYWLKLGAERAVPLFGPLVNPQLGLQRLDVASVIFAPGSPYMIARTTDTTVPQGRLFVARVAELARGPAIRWQSIATAADMVTDIQLQGHTLYLRTVNGAPRGRVLALDLARPVLAKARVAVAEPALGVLTGFAVGPDAIFTELRQGFGSRVMRQPLQGGPAVDLAPSLGGATALTQEPAHQARTAWLETSSWNQPSRVLIAQADGSVRDTGLRRTQRPAGAPELVVTEVLVPSHDGAKVPLAILHRQGLVLDGNNPTLLIAYGAYGITEEAYYDPRATAWLERDGVLAYANVRGSGAFGEAWYRAGYKATKPNTWKDGIACARHLIAQRYTSPRTLGVLGGSAGGIFVGRCVTSAPELFAAAIFEVGVMDMVRFEESANGITNVSEFGSAKVAAEFPALLEMSTYHQIKDGTAYPGVLLIHGMNDPRVDVWQSAKATARLQAATSSGKPILLRLDEQAGHGIGSTASQSNLKRADTYGFLLWQFGKLAQNG